MVGAYSQTSEPKQGSYILRPPVSASLEFDGPPGGGELILVNKASGGTKFVSIDTTSDMPAGDIVERIRAGIVAYPLSAFMESLHIQDQGAYITNWLNEPVLELRGSPGEYVLGGTEVGLGIPRPVGSLSAGFDFETGRHTFRWYEKEGQYTRIAFCDSMGTGEFISRIQSPGNDAPFQTVVAVSPGGAGYRGVYVVGFDGALPQKDIVLGDEETAIFFCVRLKGVKPRGVLLDGVRLVDVTDGFANAKLREKVL